MSHIPADRRYNNTHEWILEDTDGLMAVGITDHAQEQLGDLVFVELPEIGRQVRQGEECAVIESVKAASDIYSPLTGEIVAVNPELADAPERINTDAYGSGWIFKLRPTVASELATLLDATAYAAVVADEG